MIFVLGPLSAVRPFVHGLSMAFGHGQGCAGQGLVNVKPYLS